MPWLKKLSSAWESIAAVRAEHGDLEAAKHASRGLIGAAAEQADVVRKRAQERADQAAESFARTATEWTGREMTAADVKRSAKIGAALGAVVAAGPVVGMVLRQSRAAGHPASASRSGLRGGEGDMVGPNLPPADPTEAWEQDDIEYDQMQYEHLQDHYQHQDHLNDVIDDQIAWNEGLDMGFDGDF